MLDREALLAKRKLLQEQADFLRDALMRAQGGIQVVDSLLDELNGKKPPPAPGGLEVLE